MVNCSKRFLTLILLVSSVLILFTSHPFLQAQEKGKESVEEIKPPEGEQWVAPGDEKLYKFDINPITPREGISGGYLIYYGHFIKPPYKISIIENEVYVNNLPMTVIPEIYNNELIKIRRKKADIYLKGNRKEVELVNKVINDIRYYYQKILASSNDKTIIRNKMGEYFKKNILIENYIFESENPIIITYHIKGISQNLAFQDTPSYIGDSKDFITSRERYANNLKWELSHKNTFILITDRFSWGGYFKDDLLYICKNIMQKKSAEEKIKYLYRWSHDIGLSKLIVNNLDCNNLIETVRIE